MELKKHLIEVMGDVSTNLKRFGELEKEAGVDTSRILISDTTTSTSSVLVDDQGQRSIVNYRPPRSNERHRFDQLQPRC